jgi:hypothetical protein
MRCAAVAAGVSAVLVIGGVVRGDGGGDGGKASGRVVLTEFAGKGFDQYFDTWTHAATTQPASLKIEGKSNGVAESYPGSLDLGQADTLEVVGRELPGNSDTGLVIRLRDADGTVCSWSIGMKEFDGADFKTATRSLAKPDAVLSPGTTPGLDLHHIAAFTLTGSYSGAKVNFVFDLKSIAALHGE